MVGLQVEPAFGFRRLLPQFHSTVADLARKGRSVLLIVDEEHIRSILEQAFHIDN